jgi:hypothetical protein
MTRRISPRVSGIVRELLVDFERLGGSDVGEQIVELVRNAAGETADRLHPLTLADALLDARVLVSSSSSAMLPTAPVLIDQRCAVYPNFDEAAVLVPAFAANATNPSPGD